MQSLTQVKKAKELIEELKFVTPQWILARGTQRDVEDYEARIDDVLNGGHNPTLPSLDRLFESARKAGFKVVRRKEGQ